MIPPAGMALMALTIMLWLLWSDTIRSRRQPQILYALRIALFLIVSGVLVLNMVRYPAAFSTTGRVLGVIAVGVGLFGAWYFGRRLVRRV